MLIIKMSGTGIEKIRYLDTKNKFPHDDYVEFFEEDHVYNVKSEYLGKIVNKYDGGSSLPLKSVTETVGQYFHSSFGDLALKMWNDLNNRVRMKNDPTYKYFGCNSPDDIKKIWSKGAEEGTKMHGHFEDLANLYEYCKDHPEDESYKAYVDQHMCNYDEYMYFKKFCRDFGFNNGKRVFYRTELCLFHPELSISGMIDGLVYNNEKKGFEIIDYKRMKGGLKGLPKNPRKKVEELSEKSRGKILPSLIKSRNMPIVKYGIQLSMYKAMFERLYPDKKIVGLYLIVVDSLRVPSENALQYTEIPVDFHAQNVYEILQHRATSILEEKGDHIPDKLFTELLEFLPPVTDEDVEMCENN